MQEGQANRYLWITAAGSRSKGSDLNSCGSNLGRRFRIGWLGGLGARGGGAAHGARRRAAAEPRSSPIRRSGGWFEPGMGRGACPRYAQSTGVQIGMLRGWERGSHRQGRLGGGGISAGERVRAARVAYGLNRLMQ